MVIFLTCKNGFKIIPSFTYLESNILCSFFSNLLKALI
nr:MAG TPA: hypothetical protein [Caudoviricetes sp.]